MLLLNPPAVRPVFRDHYCSSEAKAAYLWQPLDLVVQAAVLQRAGVPCAAVDAIAEGLDLDDVLQRVRAFRPDAAVVLLSCRTWDQDRRTLQALRAAGVRLIVGSGDFLRFGTAPSQEASDLGLVDFVLTDFTTCHLPEVLAGEGAARPGLVPLSDALQGRFSPLDSAPLDYPVLDPLSFDPGHYRLPYPGFTRVASVLATYGCPWSCLYCHVGELAVRLRPTDLVCADFARVRASGLRSVYVRDATSNASPRYLAEWTAAIERAGLAMPWATFVTARPFDDALAARMAGAGCLHLQVGVETLDDELRRANGKPVSTDDHRRFVRTCHRHGLQATAHVVLGLHGETAETLAATADGLAAMDFDYVAINLAESRPGIPWSAQGVRLAVDPLSGAARADQERAGPSLEDLRAAQRRAYRSVYLRPRRLLRELGGRLRARDFADLAPLVRTLAGWR